MTWRRVPRLLTAITMTLVAVAAGRFPGHSAPQALAALNCDSGTTTHLNGWYNTLLGGWGTSASISTKIPAFCTGTVTNSGTTLAWTSITDKIQNQYAQIGYLVNRGSTTAEIFSEYYDTLCGGNACDSVGPSVATGSTHQYWEDYDTCCGQASEDMGYDNNVVAVTPYDPYGTWGGPWGRQYFGETFNINNDLPGNTLEPGRV